MKQRERPWPLPLGKPSLFNQVAVSRRELANCFRGGAAALRVADLHEFTQDHGDLTLLYTVLL